MYKTTVQHKALFIHLFIHLFIIYSLILSYINPSLNVFMFGNILILIWVFTDPESAIWWIE